MAVTRAERIAVALAAAAALAMPAVLLRPASSIAVETVAEPPLPRATDPPPLSAAYARPLFGGGGPDAAAEPAPSDAPHLVGIAGRIGTDAVAMVRSGDGAGRTLAVGASVDGWTLESLAIDAAFFTRGGQRVRVPLPPG